MSDILFWQFVSQQLKSNEPVMLLLVLESKGSSPGRQGFKMAVTKKALSGNIGGGIMEHKFVEMARQKLQQESGSAQIKKQFHNKTAPGNQSGMICSGEQTIYLYKFIANDSSNIEPLIASLENHQNGILTVSQEGIKFRNALTESDFRFEMKSEEEWIYEEKTGFKNVLHIIGGGHCSLALSKMMTPMDFYVRVYDERKDLNTFIANDYVQEKIILNDYSELTSIIQPGKNVYVVIMTIGYRTDNIALRAIINKDYKYIGVLGSRYKMQQLFNEWEKDGISIERLQKIKAPVGLQIKSETPEEIAVSIAAEIIQAKNAT